MKFEELTMNNLKTRDMPIMMRIANKLELKSFIKDAVHLFYNEEVPKEILDKVDSADEDGKVKIIEDYKNKKYMDIAVTLLNRIIEGYDKVHKDIEALLANVYGLSVKEVSNLDLDVTLKCIYNLKEQEKLVNFIKTALK